MSLQEWLLFFGACTILNIAPGPDTLYITSRTITQGRASGFLSALGVCSGAMLHALAAGIGLSAMLAASATAFNAIKWVGAAYLIYLGYKAIRTPTTTAPMHLSTSMPRRAHGRIYLQGIMVDLLNPKTALFFLAFIPQFIDPRQGAPLGQFISLGLVVILNALCIEFFLILFIDRLTAVLRRNTRVARWLERAMGAFLITLGLNLARQES